MRKPCLFREIRKALTLRPRHLSTAGASSGGGAAVKRVTRENFAAALEELRRLVRASDFVSVDLEMTGLMSAPWREAFEFDGPDVGYLKVKDSAERFAVVQFGVCPFRWEPSKDSFIAHPHNFYIFPRKELPVDGSSYEFLCQTSSMNFLAKHQFDFNTCIYEGISYISRAQEVEVRSLYSTLEDKFHKYLCYSEEAGDGDISFSSTSDVFFTERMKIQFSEWRDWIAQSSSGENNFDRSSEDSKLKLQTDFYKMRPAVVLDGFSSHQLRLIKLVIRKHFKDLTFIHTDGEISGKKKVVYTDSENDKALLMEEVLEDLRKEREAKVQSAVAFRHVVDLIASEQKLVVGHNCFLDVAHIYSKFFGPLPPTIAEFSNRVHKIFPHIIDTKHLLKTDLISQNLMKRNSKSLSSAFALVCPHVACDSKITLSVSRPYVKVEVQTDEAGSNSGAKHEAGYDAFMTGCIFAQSCSQLGIDFKLHSAPANLAEHEKLQNHMNLIHTTRCGSTILNLSTDTVILDPSYSKYPKLVLKNIVVIWGFPSNLKPIELKEYMRKSFGMDSVTMICFLDKTAALVQFSKEELVAEFFKVKNSLEKSNNVVAVLHPLLKVLEGGNTRAGDYETYKRICGSRISKVLFADQAEAMGVEWEVVAPETEKELNAGECGRSADEIDGEKGLESDRVSSIERILNSLMSHESRHKKRSRTV
ncbi:Poly(A)-specific ribonuclease PARN [Acorus calamus]|uniref:Poly(A)-specific ribonuclease PARN n=1 Tax=Acorus calamus TaxID=4465 RepID=A0AAV9D6J7_ACOCL|nr:Poly(A)-specific ribonuclease PARN [Acorus calamus]